MVQIKVTYNAKPKKTENLTVTSYLDLINQIYTVFNIEEGGIKFMKPRLKVIMTKCRMRRVLQKKSNRGVKC